MAGYSGTPLPAKLGVRDGSRVLVVDAPPSFPVLGHRRASRTDYDVIVAFCPSSSVLTRRFAPLSARLATAGALWICWPKRASGVATDLTENVVRDHGLSVGLVDVKVAAIDDVWSGLKFVRRLADR